MEILWRHKRAAGCNFPCSEERKRGNGIRRALFLRRCVPIPLARPANLLATGARRTRSGLTLSYLHSTRCRGDSSGIIPVAYSRSLREHVSLVLPESVSPCPRQHPAFSETTNLWYIRKVRRVPAQAAKHSLFMRTIKERRCRPREGSSRFSTAHRESARRWQQRRRSKTTG